MQEKVCHRLDFHIFSDAYGVVKKYSIEYSEEWKPTCFGFSSFAQEWESEWYKKRHYESKNNFCIEDIIQFFVHHIEESPCDEKYDDRLKRKSFPESGKWCLEIFSREEWE